MNPRDLPEVAAELLIERHEVQTGLRGLRKDMQAMPHRIGMALIKSPEPFLNRQLDHHNQLKNHESRLGRLKKLKNR